jgi:hypothetical protein
MLMSSIRLKCLAEEQKPIAPTSESSGFMKLAKLIFGTGSALYSAPVRLWLRNKSSLINYLQAADLLSIAAAQGLSGKLSLSNGAL